MTTRPPLTNRASTSKPPGPPIHSSPTTLISASATLAGIHPISLGPNAIIQIRARLFSDYGPINVAEGCIISERASIGLLSNLARSQNEDSSISGGVTLAPGVLIESGAVVEAAAIGAYSIIEAGARVGKGAIVGERCKICAMVEVGEGLRVPDGMVVYGSGWGDRRREEKRADFEEMRMCLVREHGEVIRKIWTGK